jgi:hypothetical protein
MNSADVQVDEGETKGRGRWEVGGRGVACMVVVEEVVVAEVVGGYGF